MRLMPAKTVRAAAPHRCGFCCDQIEAGEEHQFYRAFDPDRSHDNGKTWGAWVTERRHQRCTPEALNRKAS